jgi:hypothetical protein
MRDRGLREELLALEQRLEQKFDEKLAPYAKKTDLEAFARTPRSSCE